METKGNTISRVRGLVKGGKTDAFLTDRFLYSLVLSVAKAYIKRLDDSNKLGRYSSIYQVLPGVKLEEVSTIEAGCVNIGICCKIMRSEEPLPPVLQGSWGPVVRSITSIDGSTDIKRTDPKTYVNITKSSTFRYNKNFYYWIRNNYIYFPNVEWPVVDIEAMWEDDIEEFKCDADNCCVNRRDEKTNIPDYLFNDIEEPVRQKLLNVVQIPRDNIADNQSLLKS